MTDGSSTETDDGHAEGGPGPEGEAAGDPVATDTGPNAVEDIIADLEDLDRSTASADASDSIDGTRAALATAASEGAIRTRHRSLDVRDAAEAFVGSVIFASPLLVEDGVFDIGEHLFTQTVAGVPASLLVNTAFVVLMTYALLEWTGRTREDTYILGGLLPLRLPMILGVSFGVATILMTVWGRVDLLGAPVEAIARINVLWTVGSLGAALGDLLSDDDPDPVALGVDEADLVAREPPGGDGSTGSGAVSAGEPPTGAGTLDDLDAHFDRLEEAVEPADRKEVRRLRQLALDEVLEGFLDEQIDKYTKRDIAEAFVGSIFFSIPFLVEDGVFDVADYFLSFRLGEFPVYFLLNAVFVFGMIGLVVYWAGPKNVVVSRPLFGFVPRRIVGIGIVSFLTAAGLMVLWGRVTAATPPMEAVARISAVWTVASFGAALGDILPGESSGQDINDDLADFGEQVEDLLE